MHVYLAPVPEKMAAHFVYWVPLLDSSEYASKEEVMLLLQEQAVVPGTYDTVMFSVLTCPQQNTNCTNEHPVSYDP